MASIFSKIIAGQIPSYRIAEDERYYAFLDIRPLTRGHTLVIPKKEIDHLWDLNDELLTGLITFAKRIAKAQKAAFETARVGMLVVGDEVPHAHIHLIPMNNAQDMVLSNNPLKLSEEEMSEIAEQIRQQLNK